MIGVGSKRDKDTVAAMAEALRRLRADRGEVTADDLAAEGFSRTDIARHGDAAHARACRLAAYS